MQRYICTVKLGGSISHVVTNKGPLTVAEIAVLRRVHGNDAVSDFNYVDNIKVEPGEERLRLRQHYDTAAMGDAEPIVDQCFGVMGPLPQTLADIGISAASAAAELRAKAKAALAEADKLDEVAEDPGEEVDLADEPEDVDTLFDEDEKED